MKSVNPYEAPDSSRPVARRPRKLGWVLRLMVGVFGFYLLLGGEENGGSAAYHQGRVFARVLGGFILLLAMVPFQTPRGLKETDPPEKL